MIYRISAVVLIVAVFAGAGLLRLHEGQIQEQQPDGSWMCANDKVREIVNDDDCIYQDDWIVTGDANTAEFILAVYSGELDPNAVINDVCWEGFCIGDFPDGRDGKIVIECTHYDPNQWEINDDFIRSLCESGRVCEAMGHSWVSHWDGSYFEITCNICGETGNFVTEHWSEWTVIKETVK